MNNLDDIIPRAPDKELELASTDYHQIVQYYQNKLERHQLSSKLEKYIIKMDYCAELTRDYKSRLKVVPLLQKTYGISLPSARMLFERTQMLLGQASQIGLSQAFHVDILLGEISDLIKDCKKSGDTRSRAAALKLYKETIKELMGSADAAKYEQFEMKPIIVGFFPEKFKKPLPDNLDEEIEKIKRLKRRKEFGQKIVDVAYEEVR